MSLASVPELIAEIAAGRMVILVDDEDRENEGDLVLAAEHVSPQAINFMAKEGRGLICLTLTRAHCERLELPPMTQKNAAKHRTAFTVSIEAAQGVGTGISAADRAHTIATAVASQSCATDLVQPGHVFPLQAQDGGVLVRAGHTEAGCDLAALAGLTPAAVICEIMKDDGTMARLDDLFIFAQQHHLKIGSIASLIEHRARHESLVHRIQQRPLQTPAGLFTCTTFMDHLQGLHLVLSHGHWTPEDDIWVRVHEPLSVLDFLETDPQAHSWPLLTALQVIAQQPCGLVLLLNCGESDQRLKQRLFPTQALAPPPMDLRTYGIGAQILCDMGVGKLHILGSPRRMPSFAGYGLELRSFIAQPSEI